tara:strand:+ start:296 stop:1168 length:873 start_codon:yes stop_codon:yes gene_type:complete
MKKLLIVSGCSFTDENYISSVHPELDCSWPKWPELLAKKLDMDCINLGQNGAGNEYIYSTLLEEILRQKDKRKIGLVISAWTQCQRNDWQILKSYKWMQSRFNVGGDVFGWVKKSLRFMVSLQLICERLNVPLKQCQMLNLFDGWVSGLGKTDNELWANINDPNFVRKYKYPGLSAEEDRKICNQILMEYDPYINVKDFIGWPTIKSFGGFNIEEETVRKPLSKASNWEPTGAFSNRKFMRDGFIISEEDWEPTNYHKNYHKDMLISKYDVHPNEKGHQVIAEFMYEQLG